MENEILLRTNCPELGEAKRGKVRDIYDFGDTMLIVATDRVSAFDVVLPGGIPGKGKLLNQISLFWFEKLQDIIKNHVITADVYAYPERCLQYIDQLSGRSVLVKKARPLPVEAVIRGYLYGTAYETYKENGTICGIKLAKGLKKADKLPKPLFTPTSKAAEGHDIPLSFIEVCMLIGTDLAEQMRDFSQEIYAFGSEFSESKGIIPADTKFEFGILDGKLILIDEVLTPDSSRYWSRADYQPGRDQDSFDKQIVRDYLLAIGWNQMPPGPALPDEIIARTAARYQEIYDILRS